MEQPGQRTVSISDRSVTWPSNSVDRSRPGSMISRDGGLRFALAAHAEYPSLPECGVESDRGLRQLRESADERLPMATAFKRRSRRSRPRLGTGPARPPQLFEDGRLTLADREEPAHEFRDGPQDLDHRICHTGPLSRRPVTRSRCCVRREPCPGESNPAAFCPGRRHTRHLPQMSCAAQVRMPLVAKMRCGTRRFGGKSQANISASSASNRSACSELRAEPTPLHVRIRPRQASWLNVTSTV